MTRLNVYIYGDTAKTELVAKYQSTTAQPLWSDVALDPRPKHTDPYLLTSADGSPFECEVIGIFDAPKHNPHISLSIDVEELPRWDQQHQALHFQLVSA